MIGNLLVFSSHRLTEGQFLALVARQPHGSPLSLSLFLPPSLPHPQVQEAPEKQGVDFS